MTKAIFVGGTASHVGKSWTAAAICRYLKRRGVRVAPFKAQNMSNNSYPCVNGGEIGRAQVVQAEACGLAPASDMNPILLKPTSNVGSQVVVDGRVWKNCSAREYYTHFDYLLERALAAYQRLAAEFECIVIEGAGSIAELNLARTDLVNLGFAKRVGAKGLLVGDIDRGGIFASIIGSYCVLGKDEQELLPAFAVNRFRGDPSLFEEGVRILENRTGKKCLGVFPFLADTPIDEEDGVYLERPVADAFDKGAHPRVAILRFPRISNLTDFRLLPFADWLARPKPGRWDLIILPGTKNTIADLEWLRAQGLDRWLTEQHAAGTAILGICGGYQMLGRTIADPHGVESAERFAKGLDLLPVETILTGEKTTRAVAAVSPAGTAFPAYEIHMGVTTRPLEAQPFAIVDGIPEGIRIGRVAGTYLHGALENEGLLAEILGVPVEAAVPKDALYDRLADWFEAHADIAAFERLYL